MAFIYFFFWVLPWGCRILFHIESSPSTQTFLTVITFHTFSSIKKQASLSFFFLFCIRGGTGTTTSSKWPYPNALRIFLATFPFCPFLFKLCFWISKRPESTQRTPAPRGECIASSAHLLLWAENEFPLSVRGLSNIIGKALLFPCLTPKTPLFCKSLTFKTLASQGSVKGIHLSP